MYQDVLSQTDMTSFGVEGILPIMVYTDVLETEPVQETAGTVPGDN